MPPSFPWDLASRSISGQMIKVVLLGAHVTLLGMKAQVTPTTPKEKELAGGKSCHFLLKLQTLPDFESLLTQPVTPQVLLPC